MNQEQKLELIVKALQQRIGEIVSQYETHVALLRTEITELNDKLSNVDQKE